MKACTRTFLALLILPVGLAAQQLPSSGGAESLTLQQAVQRAVHNSRALALARIQHTGGDKAAGVLRSAFLPNLYTGSGAAYSKGFPQTPAGPPSLFNMSYTQTVFNSPLRGQVRAAEERARAGQVAVERVQDTVILETAAAYLELVKVRHTLRLLRAEQESSQRVVTLTRDRAAEGLELPIEVTRAQLTAARVEQRIAQFEGREDALEGQLRSLMAMPSGTRIEVTEGALPESATQSVGELVNLAVMNHPDLRTAELERRAREHRLKGERGGYWPTLDVVGHYAVYSRFNNFEDFFNNFERHGVNIGIRARIPIFSAQTSAAVGLAKVELSAAEQELKLKRDEVELAVRQQARASRELEATREVARLELQLAQENVRVLQAQFQEGRAPLRDLERARLEESEKWALFLDAEYQRQRAQLELLRSTGQLAKLFQ